MARYVDVDKLLKLQYRIDDSITLSSRDIVNVEDIEDLITEDVAPVIHSRWIGEYNDFGVLLRWHCERCFDETGMGSTIQEDFCPVCGAKMDLK